MSKDTLHVVPHNDGWAVKREGNERNSSTHSTQKDAIDSARTLAHDGDDIVIHRADGTIRERVTYTNTGERTNGVTTKNGTVTPSDVSSVGTRVSWAAVLAGAVVALTTYVTLTMFAFAIGVTAAQHISNQEFAIGAAVIATVSLIGSLFLGGYVASQTTAGETRKEAVIYGVLVWGALFGLMFLAGNTLAVGFGTALQPITQANRAQAPSEAEIQKMSGEDRTKYDQTVFATKANAMTVAWWAFGTLVLSLLAAIGGSLAGAGPELTFLRYFDRREPGTVVTPAAPSTATTT